MEYLTTEQDLCVIPDDRIMVEVLKQFTTPEEIEALEGELLNVNTIDIHVKHSFWKGGYARQVTIPAKTLAIGHGHTDECLNIVVSGSVSVVIDGEVRLVKGPCTFVSPPFARKIGYVHEDITWITVHATNETSVDKLEQELIIKSDTFRRYEASKGASCTEIANCPIDEFWEDRLDYFKAVEDLGFTHDQVRAISENEDDQIPFPPGTGDAIYIGTSKIQGHGVFSAFNINGGVRLAPARIAGKRTKVGRYTNHSKHPNCKFVLDSNGDIYLQTISKVSEGEELTCNYRDAKKTANKADEILKSNTQ